MVHLLKSKNGKYYFITVRKNANEFDKIVKSGNVYRSKQGCEKGYLAEAKIFMGYEFEVADHTTNEIKGWRYTSVGFETYAKKAVIVNKQSDAYLEIEFVQKLKK